MTDKTRPVPTVSAAALKDLTQRLARARPIRTPATVRGVDADRVRTLTEKWRSGFDWPAVERELDGFDARVTSTADGRRQHYLHARAAEPTGTAVLLLHGWPDTPLQFRHLIPLLLDAGHDVIAPSLAGFGYSDEPTGELSPELVADDVHHLVATLGVRRVIVHGTDWGASIGAALAEAHPETVTGLHLLQPPFDRVFMVDRETASPAEIGYLTALDAWSERAAYVSAHSHQADTLAAAFADSPVGLLAWLTERYDDSSSDNLADDDIVAATAMMWFTGTFRSSVRLYSEPASAWDTSACFSDQGPSSTDDAWLDADGEDTPSGAQTGNDWNADDAAGWGASRIEVPTAFALFPDDIGQPPREFAERFFAVQRFTLMSRGGHWAVLEEPELVAEDLEAFAASLT